MPHRSHNGNTARKQVLILGGGFAGVGAARRLKKADVDVTLVDARDYHSFQPMLYQLATGLVDTAVVAHSLRDLFEDQPNVTVHQAHASAIALDAHTVTFEDMDPVRFDYLVLALGAVVEFFGVEGADRHAFPLYTIEDAVRLRNHLMTSWENADTHQALVEDGALNVVVVGGGPTGIETAGAVAELFHGDFEEDFRGLDVDHARIILVEAGPELFPMFASDIRAYAQEALEERGVEVMLGEIVEKVEPTRVTLKSGKVLPAHTLVWGAGLRANPIVESLGIELQRGKRIAVEPELTLEGHPEVFVVGDVAWITDTKTDQVLPQLGSVALQAGAHAGESIARLVEGKDCEPFAYHDKGTMAAIGRGSAVVQLHGGRTIKGNAAWLAWGAVHLTLLSAGEDRAKAMIDWTWAGFTHDRPGRIHVDAGAGRDTP
jgi:NADH dehydrogenase